jgi:hypothetical protein
MTITDNQKIDYLFKKIGYGATKTDTNAQKLAPNEAIPSPLLLRGDKVWKQSASIPAVKPSSSTGVVTCYTGSGVIETTADNTATANRTWKTELTDWIPPQFGSTYLVNVYIHTSGDAAGAASISNKVFVTGSGNDDEWFFDYESGVLNFIGTNLPNGVNFSGKSVYIEGARYTGEFGVGGDTGAYTFTDNRLQTTSTNEEIIIDPAGTGYVAIDSTSGLIIPVGTTAERPTGQTGMFRFNSTDGQVEVYNGTGWTGVGSTESVTLDEFDGDGSTVAFTLSRTGTSASVWVSINGTVQEVTNTYTVSGTTLTFNEAPVTGDKIQVRNFFSANTTNVSTSIIQDADNDTKIQVEETADEDTIRFDIAGTEKASIAASTTTVKNDLVVEGAIKSDTFYFVKRSTDTNISYPGSYGSVTIDYEDAGDDYGSTDAMWSSVTDRFTPTVAGLWYFRASADTYSGATQESGMFIDKNGSTIASTGTIGAIRPQITTHVYMNGTTDYVQFKAYAQSAVTRGQGATTSFFEALLVKQAE